MGRDPKFTFFTFSLGQIMQILMPKVNYLIEEAWFQKIFFFKVYLIDYFK